MNRFKIYSGKPSPFGALVEFNSVNFALYCPGDCNVTLCLFDGNGDTLEEIALDPLKHRSGDVWHVAIENATLPLFYAYRMERENLSHKGESHLLLDPYATMTSSSMKWGDEHRFLGVVDDITPFDWQGDRPLDIPHHKLIIYEMHTRAFTIHASSQVENPGSFLGVIEKIPHLCSLGVNAIELLPIHEFDENDCTQHNPITGEKLYNFWGYATLNFFSLTNRYASKAVPTSAIEDFKMMVRELHKNGIEVILDVVYNHTGEGNAMGQTLSFKGLAEATYYLLTDNGDYLNYSGCGNTLNCNNPIVIEMILSSLRYWVVEMHVDGFRFDLASIFKRGQNGAPLPFSPLVDAISSDPILSKTKLIAEPWDAAGLYEVGSFYRESSRWSEWNGRYRDAIRRFIKGTPGAKGEFATALCGSEDLFRGRTPLCSLNFITCHDGFTLADLVSYNQKHNISNGEQNRDGTSFNDSWNCGAEGVTGDPQVLALRIKQMKNFHLALMLSQGIPMLHMGDEYGHSKRGNNNTWCQDNALSWFLWDELDQNQEFHRFYRLMIAFRKKYELLMSTQFLTEADVEWHGAQINRPNWDNNDQFIAFILKDRQSEGGSALYAAFNAHDHPRVVAIPKAPGAKGWFWAVDTSKASPYDVYEDLRQHSMPAKKLTLPAHSAIVLTTG